MWCIDSRAWYSWGCSWCHFCRKKDLLETNPPARLLFFSWLSWGPVHTCSHFRCQEQHILTLSLSREDNITRVQLLNLCRNWELAFQSVCVCRDGKETTMWRGGFIWREPGMTTLSSEANQIFVLQNHVVWTCCVLRRKTMPGMLLESFKCLFGAYFSSPLLQVF